MRLSKTLKLAIALSTIIATVLPYAHAAQLAHGQLEFSNTPTRYGLNRSATRLDTNEGTYNSSKVRGSLGIGRSTIYVEPNPNNRFYEGRGLSFVFGLSRELAITNTIALTARLDFFPTIDLSLVEDTKSHLGVLATTGIVIGKIQQPKQLYFMAALGPGAIFMGSENDEDCVLCSDKEAGSSAGISGRVSIGLTLTAGQLIELVFIKAGDNGENRIYTNDEKSYAQAVFLQVSSMSK